MNEQLKTQLYMLQPNVIEQIDIILKQETNYEIDYLNQSVEEIPFYNYEICFWIKANEESYKTVTFLVYAKELSYVIVEEKGKQDRIYMEQDITNHYKLNNLNGDEIK